MPSVFLSYGSPDAAVVLRLRDRLKALGLEIWEYQGDMPAGADINETVLQAINEARLAIICFSDETAEREWITREVDWCFKVVKDRAEKLGDFILPLWVGPHPESKVPKLLAGNSVFDLWSPGVDAALPRLAEDILARLGLEAPQVVPTALFAMTRTECGELFAKWAAIPEDDPVHRGLCRLCAVLGMKNPPALFDLLLQRYDTRPEDFAPFQPGRPLIEMVYESLAKVNAARMAAGSRPIFLRWVHDELFGTSEQNKEARDLWLSGDSLLILDSISAFHEKIQSRILRLPSSLDRSRAAVVWIPPYTQLTADLEEPLGTTVDIVDSLGDDFRRLEEEMKRSISFDTSTPLSLRLWLLRTFGSLSSASTPLQGNVAAMNSRRRLNDYLSRRQSPIP
jgi:TIR domain